MMIKGVSIAVKTPFRIKPKVEKAPNEALMSMDLEVPTACEDIPIESPWAIGLLTLDFFKIKYHCHNKKTSNF